MPTLEYKHHTIAYEYYFKNEYSETMVLLHDSLGCIKLWRNLPQLIHDTLNVNVLVYDRIGYGASSSMETTYRTIDYMNKEADILLEICNLLNITHLHLLGHSDGGTIALLAAASYPSNIHSLITIGAHIYVEDITLQGILDAKYAYENTILPEKLAKYHGKNTYNIYKAWQDIWLSDRFKKWNITNEISKIQCPGLIIQGALDEYGSISQPNDIYNNLKNPSSKMAIIPNTKHSPHKEDEIKFLALIKVWWNEIMF